MEGRSTVEDRRPRNSYHRDRYVFAARAASACRRSWTAVGDDQRPIEGTLPRQQHRDLIHIHFERVCRFITFVLITVAINHSFTLSLFHSSLITNPPIYNVFLALYTKIVRDKVTTNIRQM